MTRLNVVVVASVIGCVGGLAGARRADAHFMLQAPANWMSQVPGDGSPQKMAPCGNEGGGTATNAVTNFRPGETVTVTIQETVVHPGWYKVVLSTTGQAGLAMDPTPTPGRMACGDVSADGGIASLPIQNPPVYPVLADGMLYHTAAMTGARSFTVKLPTNMTCTSNCVLQVVEFMANHGAPCFYHHCANITIQGTPVDGGTGTTGSGGATGGVDAGRDASGTTGAGGSTGTTGSGGATGTTGAGGSTTTTGSGGSTATTGSGGSSSTTGAGGSATTSGSGGSSATTGAGGSSSTTGAGGSSSTTGAGGGKGDGGGCAVAASGVSGLGAASLMLALVVSRLRRRRR